MAWEYGVMPNPKQMEDEMHKAADGAMKGSKWPGMSYEQGVEAALRWALGEAEYKPMGDEDE